MAEISVPTKRVGGLSRLGLQKTSLVDFPGHPASVLFTAGCPLACPYCHNSELISRRHPPSFIAREDALSVLASRRKLISHVVVSGGEPTVHQDLAELFDQLADLELCIKLDTCGMYPQRLEKLLSHTALRYVALDIKTAPENYVRVGGSNDSGDKLLSSMELIRSWKHSGGGEYEFRTVMASDIATSHDLKRIEALIESGETWHQNPVKNYTPQAS